MATGLSTDFVIYHEQLHSGFVEVLAQETNIFNGASQGAITLRPKQTMGDYDREAFFGVVSNLVTRRVTVGTAATAAVTDLALPEVENVRVKLNRKIGPVAQTRDAFRKISRDPQELSFIIGQQWAKAVAVDMVNSAVRAGVAAIMQDTGLTYDGSSLSPGTISSAYLIRGLAKAGDSANGIIAWVMHSGTYFQLMESQTSVTVENVAGTVINQGTAITLNRPVIITDSPVLYTAGASPADTPRVLGLRAGAITVDESELTDVVTDVITGQENLIQRIQGEFAYNVGVLGWKWDVTSGGANPDDTALALTTNWDPTFTDDKSRAGIAIKAAES